MQSLSGWNVVRKALSPNQACSKTELGIIIGAQVIFAFLFWIIWAPPIVPRPLEVVHAFQKLWMRDGLGVELAMSFMVNLEALAISSIISLGLAYLSVTQFVRIIASAASKLRFLGLTGLSLMFTYLTPDGHWLKVSLLVFGMTVFFVTAMASEVANIPKAEFDHARTLRMSEWRVVWEVVVLGKMDVAIETIRQNAAIGWMMLTMVEGIVKSEGGVGAMLLNENKHMLLDAVFAIQLTILLVGLLFDYIIGVSKNIACPWVSLSLQRR
ncbi:MAG: nitrate ABC transporter permease [Candidatus Ryanbacteria bacterium RIFCSPHIGHO2_02_FULL_45_17b]|uniref:Nitrate ABC transporter permease n=1 Tax=Candidatus Ryanbacteria bacterium RIFCSPHIGHO2_01_FULL_45_22 TaxID=1802114 RepID=A0A1G2G0E5_9BACT|nr:MAG: nitrate ABC transporter permease [Candidatus Ryanbacteria bacterium RIFCSPHIGHO2_01_FULL_45_22]OGZ47378.1 MAG: nitrate ABC transporter permease [Candidatus Ryanbacteria bacterium RIFCSPHIGHO2_02_FULL_45_17b]